jgi:hypothetical protein
MFAGAQKFVVAGDAQGLQALLHYPCTQPSSPTPFGP